MERLKKYPSDYSKPFLLTFHLLSLVNINFFNDHLSLMKRNGHFLYLVPSILTNHIVIFVSFVKVFYEGRDLFSAAHMLPVFIADTQELLKAVIILSNKKLIENIIDQMGMMWRTDNLTEKQIKTKDLELRVINNLCYGLNIFVTGATYLYLVSPLLEGLFRYFILNQDAKFEHPISCDYPFDPVKNWLVYVAVYLYQMFCSLRYSYLLLGSEFLMMTLCAHLTTEFMLIRDDLEYIDPTKIDRNRNHDDKLGILVKRHQKLIELSQQLDNALNKITFISFLFATIIISFFGFIAAAVDGLAYKLTYFVMMLVVMSLIFNLCYYCEKVKSASEEVSYAAYHNNWLKGDLKYQKAILFIIVRSQKPCCLTSLRYIPITLNTFTRVLGSTWSYFSLVNTMYNKPDDT